MLPHIKSNENHWTVIVDGVPKTFDPTHPEYHGLVECVLSGDSSEFTKLMDTGSIIDDWSYGHFAFNDGVLTFQGEEIALQPTARIVSLIKNGYDYTAMLAYLENLYSNVSQRAVTESYDWCAHKGLPITKNGMLIGYKGVTRYNGEERKDLLGRTLKSGDLVDKYTGKSFRNNIGDENSMLRRHVCDDHTEGCSQGLHVGTYEYASNWGPVVVLVEFNPADIVSVPSDCSYQKMRVSKYKVLKVVAERLEDEVYEDEDWDDWDEEDEDYE